MTAFDNIKTNNWPSASNEFEDFLVLELPLNDATSLTESRRDIVAGSKLLFPKRTLTNGGVSLEHARIQPDYGATGFTKSTNWRENTHAAPEIGLFNGDGTATQPAMNGNNAEHWFAFATPLTNVTKVETRMGYDGYQGARAYMGNGTTSYISPSGHATYFTVYSGAATTFSKIGWRSNNGSGASAYDIRITDDTGTYVLTSNENSRKHYNNNAILTSTSSNYIQTSGLNAPDSNDYTYECWAKAEGTISNYSLFHTNPTSRTGILLLFGSSTTAQMYFGNGGSWSNYLDMTFSSIGSEWHHYAIVRQGGGTVSFYIDGQLSGSKSSAGAHTHGELVLGRQSGDNNLYWNGAIQDVRVYKTAKYTANFTPPSAILS